MNGRRWVSVLTMVALVPLAGGALAQRPATRPGAGAAAAVPGAAAAGPAVATVGTARIPRAELDQRAQLAMAQYRQSAGNRELPPEMLDLMRRQVVESLIRMQLLSFEADRTGMRGSREEAEAALRQAPVFNPGGQFDAARFENAKTNQKPVFDGAIAQLSRQIGAQRLYASLESRYKPSEAEAKAAASRQLTRALVDHVALRVSDFNGNYPEPRESQIVAWYEAHRAEYRRPERATLTIAFVNTPGLPEAERRVPGKMEAWTRRMHAVADSLLASIAHGGDFDAATRDLGPRSSVTVEADNFPGYWKGTPAQVARVFDPKLEGRVLPEAVPAAEGWLLVRVDAAEPAHLAPLREVAREIRAALRRESRDHHEGREAQALYAEIRDSLAGPGWKLRYAAVDTAALSVARPGDADVEHWYRAHQADYSSFDPQSGGIVVRPLAEVREEIERRFVLEQRTRQGRALADGLWRAWAAGKRERELEGRVAVRETAPLVPGSVIDTGFVAAALGDTLWNMGTPRGAGIVPYPRGWIVWAALDRVERVVPTFEQARPALSMQLANRRVTDDVAGARAYFARDSMRFHFGNVIHFTRFAVSPPPILGVRLTRADVEKWHHDHLDRYSAAELVTAKHILVRPADGSSAADAAAKARATDLLHRAQAGEDFSTLAKTYSDDPATKDAGGDLGAFGRGTMLDAFEKAAFALDAGQLCDHVVHSEVGYHVIYCVDHVPAYVHPLPLIYSNVSADAARARADEIARGRADSLFAAIRSPRAMRAAADRMGYITVAQRVQQGVDAPSGATKSFFDQLEKLSPGAGITAPVYVKGEGFWIGWVDSISPPAPPTWEQARTRVLADYRRGAGRRALEAKRDELDSLAAAGWSFDSLAALWGGPDRALDVTPGRGLTGLGVNAEFDSLTFGTARGGPMPLRQPSRWVQLPNALVRFRVTDRVAPAADVLASRASTMRSAELERRLREYFVELEKRWPVKILDPRLRDVALAEPPPGLAP